MEWVVGIGIALFLFISFPRPMIIITGLVILIGGAGFGWMVMEDNRRIEEARQLRESVVLSASFDPVRCSPEFPIIVRFENKNPETLLAVSFDLAGFPEGYSEPVYRSFSAKSDRIIPPYESYEACWSVPGVYGISNPPPPESMTWRATVSYPTFGTPP
jgi:hypothetical protein